MKKWIGRGSMILGGLGASLLLDGCSNLTLLQSKGTIGSQEQTIIYVSIGVMLLVVLPVLIMAFVFPLRYRASKKNDSYDPNWRGSSKIEAIIWIVPLIIVAFLAGMSWIYSHSLNPYKPIKSVTAASPPVKVEVVSLDWKWLFIYPQQDIATVNKLVIPTHVPVHFYLTSATVMNSFFIPQLGSMIMAMPGMQTQLNLEAKTAGTYHGLSAQFSGAGFSGMGFKAVALKNKFQFRAWVQKVRNSGKALTTAAYQKLAKPSRYSSASYYAAVAPNLFHTIIAKYMPKSQLADASRHAGT